MKQVLHANADDAEQVSSEAWQAGTTAKLHVGMANLPTNVQGLLLGSMVLPC